MHVAWYMINGRNHVRKSTDPWTAECGLEPLFEEPPTGVVYDTVTQVPPTPCRSCLMFVAMGDDVIGVEPMDFAKGRGVIPIEEDDVQRLGLE